MKFLVLLVCVSSPLVIATAEKEKKVEKRGLHHLHHGGGFGIGALNLGGGDLDVFSYAPSAPVLATGSGLGGISGAPIITSGASTLPSSGVSYTPSYGYAPSGVSYAPGYSSYGLGYGPSYGLGSGNLGSFGLASSLGSAVPTSSRISGISGIPIGSEGISGGIPLSSAAYSPSGVSYAPSFSYGPSHGLGYGPSYGLGSANLGSLGLGPGGISGGIPISSAGYGSGGIPISSGGISGGNIVSQHVTVTNRVAVPVPQPYPVAVERPVAVPVAHSVRVPVDRPYPVPIPQRVAVPVERPYPVPVERPVPVPIAHPIPVAVPRPVAVPVPRPYPVPVVNNIAVPVAQQAAYQQSIPVFAATPAIFGTTFSSPLIATGPAYYRSPAIYGGNSLLGGSGSIYGGSINSGLVGSGYAVGYPSHQSGFVLGGIGGSSRYPLGGLSIGGSLSLGPIGQISKHLTIR